MPPEDLSSEARDPPLPPEIVLYVQHLDDRVSNYRRFFDSLLVARPDHEAFFQDLRHFREQEHITTLLRTKDVDGPTLKELYRECTSHFLDSRFAHPWCRNEFGMTRSGFLNSTTSKRKQAEAKQVADDRFHNLLVPIWIPFRRRMMPTEEELAQFLTKFEANEIERRQRPQEQQQTKPVGAVMAKESKHVGGISGLEQAPNHKVASFNAEAFVAEEDDLAQIPDQRDEGSQQAAHLFIGVAAASFLASNKRARKYVMSKVKK